MFRPFSSLTSEKDSVFQLDKKLESPENSPSMAMEGAGGSDGGTDMNTILSGIYEKLKSLENIEEKVSNIDKTVTDLKASVCDAVKVAEEAKQLSSDNDTKCKALQKQVNNLEKRNFNMQSQMNKLLENNLRLESQSRRSNLNLDRVPEESNEKPEITLRIFRNILVKLDQPNKPSLKDVKIERCHRRAGKKNQPRPIIIKCHSFEDREAVWKKRDQFKQAGYFLREDFPDVYEQRRAKLRPIMKAAKNDLRYKNLDISISVDRLYFDGKMYHHDQLENLPDGLRPSQLSTRNVGDKTLFFHKESPFSNFHPSNFTIDNQEYNSCEQYYQFCKATFFNDDKTAYKIMSTDDPKEQYQYGNQVESFDSSKWLPVEAIKAMEKGVHAKFSQNEDLAHILVATRGTSIVECSPSDLFWGSGLGLYHPHVADSGYYTGQNKLGNILEDVRQHLMAMST